MKLWRKLLIIGKNNEHWKDIMLLLELFLCTPFSNATLERFFSHLKVVKTQLRSKLSAESLNSIMRIRMKGLSLEEFKQYYASKCAEFSIIPKGVVLINLNEKNITERKSNKRKRIQFDINELTSESSYCSIEEEC